MTALSELIAELLRECYACDILLEQSEDGGLTIDAPDGALTDDLLQRLKANKPELLDALERFEERAAIMEWDAGLGQLEAEQLAWRDLLGTNAVPSEQMSVVC